jgi:hypothetical protein
MNRYPIKLPSVIENRVDNIIAAVMMVIYCAFGSVLTSDAKTVPQVTLTPEERAWLDANRDKLVLIF